MRSICGITAAVLLLVGVFAFGAEQTWTGEISDSSCGKEHMGAEGEPVPPAPECIKVCLRGGAKYLFVADGEMVYKISNQDNPDIAKFAGKPIKLTGELKGDVLTVTKIEPN